MEPRKVDPRTTWILWAAFLLAQPVFVVVGVTTAIEPASGPLGPALAFAAAGPALLSVAFGRLVGPSAQPTASIVRWALAESVAVTGLVVRMTGGSTLLASFLAGAGFLLILLQPPRSE